MKILPITINNIYKCNSALNKRNDTNTPIVNSNQLTNDIVSFSAKKHTIKDLRLIPGITCACCGVETIPNGEIDTFMNTKIYYSSSEALSILKKAGYFKFKKSDFNQASAYTFCKLCANLYEDETFSEIFDKDVIRQLYREHSYAEKVHIAQIEKMTKQLARTSSYMVKELDVYSSRMGDTEYEVFNILKDESKKYPNKNFSELLSNPKLKEQHLKKLETYQNEVFAKVIGIAAKMTPESFNQVLNTVNASKKIFDCAQSETFNKRTNVLETFEKLAETIPEKKLMDEILLEINNLPSSKNNASSFIIKYAECNSNLIADQLLRGSAATHEHVKPRRRKNDNGVDDNSNYIVLCRNCNSARGTQPYFEFMKTHPKMIVNLQKYLNKVIEYINNGLLIGFDKYPWEIKEAVYTESNNVVNLNLNDLDLLEAENNRKKFRIK